jgi:hypothetical protein
VIKKYDTKLLPGILMVLGVLASPALGDTYVWKSNAELQSNGVSGGETYAMSTVSKWKYAATYSTNLPVMAPWAGIYTTNEGSDGQGGTLYWQYTCEARMCDNTTATLNIDHDVGSNTISGYRDGTGAAVYNVLGKFSGKSGTVNMNGHTVWVQDLQCGTGTTWTLNMDAGSKLYMKGNFQLGYGASVTTTLNMQGTAKVQQEGASFQPGRTTAASQVVNINLTGSSVDFDAVSMKMNNYTSGTVGVDALRQNITFIMDSGGASPITISGAGTTALAMGVDSRLILQFTAVPSSKNIVLFDLTDATGGISGSNGGKFHDSTGTTINEGDIVTATLVGDPTTKLYYTLTYVGGTGNDVALEAPIGVTVRDASDATDYTSWAIGTGKGLNTAYIMNTSNCVLVKNTGVSAIDIGLSATGTNWTLASSTGADQCVLMGLFNSSSAPASGDFSTSYDLLSNSITWATSSGGNGHFEGAGNGVNIASGASSKLYMLLKTPTSVSSAAKASETTTVTISCKEH